MAVAIGNQTVVGFGAESTYGTEVAPTRFLPIVSESLALSKTTLTDPSMFPGSWQAPRSVQRAVTGRTAGGDMSFVPRTKGFGLLLKHIFGTVAAPAQQGGTAAYLHTFTPGLLGGQSLTIQKQLRTAAGSNLQTFDYPGCKITQAEFSIETGGVLMLNLSIDAQDEVKNGSPASASYGTGIPFTFQQGTVKFNDTAITDVIKGATVTIARPLDVEQIGLGNGGLKSEPVENDFMQISGQLTSQFENIATYYDRFAADTALEFTLLFEGATIESPYKDTLELTIADIRLDGESPKVGGPGVVAQTIPFTGFYDATNPSIQARYITTDTTP